MGFADRLFSKGREVYQRIESGDVVDVEAECMDAHLDASGDEES